MSVLWNVLIVLLLIVLNGFFAMSELAIVSSRRGRLKQMSDEGVRGAKIALKLSEDPGSFLSTVQIGITAIGVLAGAFSGATIADEITPYVARIPGLADAAQTLSFTGVVIVITCLSLVVGELVPKQIAINDAERTAARVARPMAVLARVGAPAVWFLRRTSNLLIRMMGLPLTRQVTVTEEEVKSLVAEATEAGVVQVAERDMIDGVLRLADRPARSIMTPRVDVIWLDPSDPPEEIRRQITESGRSRFPVSRNDVEEIEGVVYAKDLLDRMLQGMPLDLTASLRPPLYVHDGTPVLKLLELFRSSGTHMALVVDEYGSFQGIVTPTDILESIAGEFPSEEEEGEESAVRRDDGSWLLDGRIPIDQVERLLERRDLNPDDEDFHTLAGFVLWQLGHVPSVGESFVWHDLRFEVVDMDARRIDRLLVSPIDTAASGAA